MRKKRPSKVLLATKGGRFRILRTTAQHLRDKQLILPMKKVYFPVKDASPRDIAEAIKEVSSDDYERFIIASRMNEE